MSTNPFEQQPDTSYFDVVDDPNTPALPAEAERKASFLSAVSDFDNPLARQFLIKQELLANGQSPTADQELSTFKEQRSASLSSDALMTLQDPSLSTEERLTQLQMISEEEARNPSIRRVFLERAAAQATAEENSSAENHQLTVAEYMDSIEQATDEIAKIRNELNFTDSESEVAVDFVSSALLPGFAYQFKEVIDQVDPTILNMAGAEYILPGEAKAQFQEWFAKQEPEAKVEAVRKLVAAINNNKFWGGDNAVIMADLTQGLLDDINEPSSLDRTLLNIFGVMDTLGIALAGRSGYKALSRVVKRATPAKLAKIQGDILNSTERIRPGSVADTAAQVAPEDAHQMFDAALKDESNELARVLNTHQQNIVSETILPKMPEARIRPMPELNDATAIDYSRGVANATAREIDASMTDLEIKMASQADITPHVHLSKSRVQLIDDGYEMEYVISRGIDRPFTSIAEARSAAKTFRGVSHGSEFKYRILARNWETGDYVPVEDLPKFPKTKTVEKQVQVEELVPEKNPSIDERIDSLDQGGDTFKADILREVKKNKEQDLNALAFRLGQEYGFDFPTQEFTTKVRDAIFDLREGGILKAEPSAKGDGVVVSFAEHTFKPTTVTKTVTEEVPIPKAERPKGDYLIQFRARHFMNPNDALDEVTALDNSIITTFLGNYAHFLDKDSYLAKWIARAGNVQADLTENIKKGLRRILEPLTNLSTAKQKKVYSILEEGEREQKWFSPRDLSILLGDDKDALEVGRAYFSVRRFQESVHRLLNKSIRQQLIGEQMKHILFKRGFKLGENQTFGRMVQIKDVDPKARLFWDAKEGKFKTMTRDDLVAYYDQGGQVVGLRRPMRHGSTDFRYALYDPKDAGGIGIRELPEVVLRDIPGYITRVYDVTHIVRKKVLARSDDGGPPKEKWIPIHMASNKVDADSLKFQLEEAAKAAGEEAPEIKVFRSRELSIEEQQYANRTSVDFLYDTGQLFFSSRGEELLGIDGRRQLKSIADSLTTMLHKASESGTLEPLVQKLKGNWEKRFSQLFETDKGQMPWFGKLVRRGDIPADDAMVSEANALRNHIKILAGIDQPRTLVGAKRLMISWTDYLATAAPNKFTRALSDFTLRNIDRDPFNAVKSLNFIRLIVLNPLRQLILQSRQASVYLGVDHGLKYFMSGNGIRDYFGLLAGTMTRHSKGWSGVRASMAKRMGMSEKEYEQFVDTYLSSGFHDSVDSHLWTQMVALDRNAIESNSKIMDAIYGSKNIMSDTLKLLRVIGFDAGERFQLIGAYLASRNKFMKTNPKLAKDWAKPEFFSRIVGEARQLAFNMNRAGTLGHQKGILGVMFQFMSHTTKSLQFLLPEDPKIFGLAIPGYKKSIGRLANKVISDREKGRIAAIQFGMYGTGGLGLTKIYEEVASEIENKTGVEIPKEVSNIAREGLEGTAFNLVVNGSLVDNQVEYSKSLSPFGGSAPWMIQNPVARMVDWTANTNVPFAEMFLGPAYSFLTRDVVRGVETMNLILGNELTPLDTSIPEKALDVLNVGVRTFVPLYNNLLKARAELAIGRYISLAGNEGIQASSAEILSKAILGIGSVSNRQIGDEYRRLAGVKGLERIPAEFKDIADHSRMVYSITKQYLQEAADHKITPEEMYDALYHQAVLNRELLTPQEYDYVYNKRMPELMRSDFSEDSMEMKFVKLIVDTYGEGPTDPFDNMLEKIKNYQPFAGQEELIKALERFREIESERQ